VWAAASAACTAAPTKIVIEAEAADKGVKHWVVRETEDKAVSGGKYLSCPPVCKAEDARPEKGTATYTFQVPRGGTYYLWVRCMWRDGCADSLWVQVDGKPERGSPERGYALVGDGTFNIWRWRSARGLRSRLESGTHKLTLSLREHTVRVDQFLLVDDRDWVPVTKEPPDLAASR
jgi:hypothetical protein